MNQTTNKKQLFVISTKTFEGVSLTFLVPEFALTDNFVYFVNPKTGFRHWFPAPLCRISEREMRDGEEYVQPK